jgi:DNA replication protein DnaC
LKYYTSSPGKASAASSMSICYSPSVTGERAEAIATYSEIPLLIIDDLGMRKLPAHTAEDLLEIVVRRYENSSETRRPLPRSSID